MPTTSSHSFPDLDLAKGRDRRGWVRFACELSGACQPITALESGNHWPANVFDISNGGIGLLLSRRFEPGTLLAVELGQDRSDTICLPLARVRRVLRHGNYWLLGCSWADELSNDDLHTLLGPVVLREALWRKVRKTLNSLEGHLERRPRPARQTIKAKRSRPLALALPPVPPAPERRSSRWHSADALLHHLAGMAAQWLVPLLALARFRPM